MPPKKSRKGRKKRTLDPLAIEKARVEEAERRRRQLVMRQARLNDIIEIEKSMTAISIKAIEARWISFLRECKQKELVAKIETTRRNFESVVDRKSAAISMLLNDLSEAEEQYRHAYRSHMEVVDGLLDLQKSHTETLQTEFEADLMEMKGDFELERAELEQNHKLELSDLQLILGNMAIEAEKMEKKLQEETSEAHETAAEKIDEEKKQMQVDLIKTSEEIRAELDTRYKEFMATAQVNMKDYMDKSKEDQETTERIAAQLKKIDKLQETVTSWRTNIARNAREWEQRNSAIQAERDSTCIHLKQLKETMQLWRQKQARFLAELVRDSTNCENDLEGIAKKAERILRLIELCKPLETERERVLSFEANQSPADIEEDVRRRVNATESGALEGEKAVKHGPAAAADWQYLERFWTIHNKAVLDSAAIAQERHYLESENQQLQSILKQYLDDITVNDSVMNNNNNTLLYAKPAPNVVQMYGDTATGGNQFNTVVDGRKYISDVQRQMVHR